jgi:uncharacterized protein (DUF169 family)
MAALLMYIYLYRTLVMNNYREIAIDIKEKLGMKLSPVGVLFSDELPEGALHFKKKGSGCITPLIFKSAKGKTVAFDDSTTGWPCSSFYLGYSDWIFPGIEKFLSNEEVHGREPERFMKNPETAKKFVESFIPENRRKGAVIFKPLEQFIEGEKPEIVIFFANPDQLSALVFLINFAVPDEERIVTKMASACISIFTSPMKYAQKHEKKAVWGLHDISVRKLLPKDLMTLTLTYELFMEVYENINESFVSTENWEKLKERNR